MTGSPPKPGSTADRIRIRELRSRLLDRRNHQRLALALVLSLVAHALLVRLDFGGQELGFPSFRFPWEERRAEVRELRVELVQPPVAAVEPVPRSVKGPLPSRAIEPRPSVGPVDTPSASTTQPARPTEEASAPQSATSAVAIPRQDVATGSAEPKAPSRADAPRDATPLPLLAALPARSVIAVQTFDEAALFVPSPPPEPSAALPPSLSPSNSAPSETTRLEAERDEAAKQATARQEALRVEAERLEADRQAAARREAARQELARQEASKVEATRLEAAREAAAKQEVAQQEAARQQAARVEATRLEVDRQEVARQSATRMDVAQQEAARQEAARIEVARQEAEQKEAAQQAASRREVARQDTARVEAARIETDRQEAERQAAARREVAQQEAARQEAARTETARLDAERQDAAQQAAARQEASRLEAARLQAEGQAAAQQAAAQREASRQDAARAEAARADAERQEAARSQAAKDDEERRETERREASRQAMGRQLNAEAAQRAAAALANRQPEPRPYSLSNPRRGRLFGRADPNAELVLYAEAWARKIQFNTPLELVRDLNKQTHIDPVVTVAIRSDGSVETVTFVRSSGAPEIDEAIRRIVQSQVPYKAFPPALARDFDVIEIRRTWYFDVAVRLD